MTAAFPHPSRPGYHHLAFPENLRAYVAQVAAALFPGDGTYPDGAHAQVDLFVAERASEEDVAVLTRLASAFPASTAEEARASVARMETDDQVSFLYLIELLVHGYYASRRVLAAMADRGYRYHGAPQPLGYPSDDELMLPGEQRGSFIPTNEVTRAAR